MTCKSRRFEESVNNGVSLALGSSTDRAGRDAVVFPNTNNIGGINVQQRISTIQMLRDPRPRSCIRLDSELVPLIRYQFKLRVSRRFRQPYYY